MRRWQSSFRSTAIAGDLLVAAVSLYFAFLVRTHVSLPGTEGLLPPERVRFTFGNVLLVATAQAVFLSLFGLYETRERFRDPLPRVLLPALFSQLLALSSIYFLAFAQTYAFPRSVLVVYLVIDGVLLALWRALLDRIFPQPRRRAVILGTGPSALLIADAIRKHPWTGVEVAGLLGGGVAPRRDLPVLGRIENLPALLTSGAVDEVILTPDEAEWRERIADLMPASRATDLLVWPSPFETMIGRLRFRIVGDLPLLEARLRPLVGPGAVFKRVFDVLVAALLLIATSPLLLLSAAFVGSTSPGGIVYRQLRVGKNGESFSLWKLRTMKAGAEIETGAVLSNPGDPRVTAVGRLLRAMRIDEIPQLWNVLVGDMSLVGPRPERPEFTERFLRSVPGWSLRHAARPGLTGLAQVSGEYSTEPEIKLRYDLAYLNNWSFGLDLAILLRTLRVILTRRGI